MEGEPGWFSTCDDSMLPCPASQACAAVHGSRLLVRGRRQHSTGSVPRSPIMDFWVEDVLGVQTLGHWHPPSWQSSPLMQQLTCRPRHRPPSRRWLTGKLCRAGHRLPHALALQSNPSRGRVRVLRCRPIPSRIRCALQHAPMMLSNSLLHRNMVQIAAGGPMLQVRQRGGFAPADCGCCGPCEVPEQCSWPA